MRRPPHHRSLFDSQILIASTDSLEMFFFVLAYQYRQRTYFQRHRDEKQLREKKKRKVEKRKEEQKKEKRELEINKRLIIRD